MSCRASSVQERMLARRTKCCTSDALLLAQLKIRKGKTGEGEREGNVLQSSLPRMLNTTVDVHGLLPSNK